MSYINTVPAAEATGAVRALYERQQGKYGYVPNYAKVFCHRPEIMPLWADLLYGIRKNLDRRRFELVTVAAAVSVRSSYCTLAHGQALLEFFTPDEVRAIVDRREDSPLTDAEKAMMRYAGKVARDAAAVTAGDAEALKAHGFTDGEIFDIAAAAAARAFFAQLCEGLGAYPDAAYREIDAPLRRSLTVGRPLDLAAPEQLVDAA
jgi:uncharacterized peroxidase-related enzyme